MLWSFIHFSEVVYWLPTFSMLLFSHLVMSNSLQLHGLQAARPPCPSPSPEVCPSSCKLPWWCHPAMSSSDAHFSSCPKSFPASGTFLMSWLFASYDQNTGASASVLLTSIQGLFPFRLISLILLCKQFSGESQFKCNNSLQFCLLYGPALTCQPAPLLHGK